MSGTDRQVKLTKEFLVAHGLRLRQTDGYGGFEPLSGPEDVLEGVVYQSYEQKRAVADEYNPRHITAMLQGSEVLRAAEVSSLHRILSEEMWAPYMHALRTEEDGLGD